ncbi:MAG: hypothetical protein ACRCT8_16460 [Lacipirellulaceae bacterium]
MISHGGVLRLPQQVALHRSSQPFVCLMTLTSRLASSLLTVVAFVANCLAATCEARTISVAFSGIVSSQPEAFRPTGITFTGEFRLDLAAAPAENSVSFPFDGPMTVISRFDDAASDLILRFSDGLHVSGGRSGAEVANDLGSGVQRADILSVGFAGMTVSGPSGVIPTPGGTELGFNLYGPPSVFPETLSIFDYSINLFLDPTYQPSVALPDPFPSRDAYTGGFDAIGNGVSFFRINNPNTVRYLHLTSWGEIPEPTGAGMALVAAGLGGRRRRR